MSQQRKVKRSGTKGDLLKMQKDAKTAYLQAAAELRQIQQEFQAYRSLIALVLHNEGGEWIVLDSDYEDVPRNVRIVFEPVEGDDGGVLIRLIELDFSELDDEDDTVDLDTEFIEDAHDYPPEEEE